jgi:magnesium-transporting ATPase (P-type)
MDNKYKTITILIIGIMKIILGIVCAIFLYMQALKLDTMPRGGSDAFMHRIFSFISILYSLVGLGIIYLRNFARKLSIYFDLLIIALCILMLTIFGKDSYLDFSIPHVRLTWFLLVICAVFIICFARPKLKKLFK